MLNVIFLLFHIYYATYYAVILILFNFSSAPMQNLWSAALWRKFDLKYLQSQTVCNTNTSLKLSDSGQATM